MKYYREHKAFDRNQDIIAAVAAKGILNKAKKEANARATHVDEITVTMVIRHPFNRTGD